MTTQLLEAVFRRKDSGFPLEAYARVRRAYEILVSCGNTAAAERICARHPEAARVWEEAAKSA